MLCYYITIVVNRVIIILYLSPVVRRTEPQPKIFPAAGTHPEEGVESSARIS